jgi:hypothetical protein
MYTYYRSLGKWTVMKLVVWAFAGVVGLEIVGMQA